MGKTRDLFKKIRDTKGTFHEKLYTGHNYDFVGDTSFPIKLAQATT